MSKPTRKVSLIIDLQFGSTGKGALAGYLATRDKPDTVVTAWAANAGHTFIDGNDRKYVHTMLANGVVSTGLKQVLIGPGSIIDPDNLLKEIKQCADKLVGVDIVVHQNAAVITDIHRDEEAAQGGSMTKIGSTKKGCGAAAIQRIRREPKYNNTAKEELLGVGHPVMRFIRVATPAEYNACLDKAENILVEGAQGHSLSMYHGFYPYCTSRDVSTAQILADCGIPPFGFADIKVIGTARTYPIRVANRFNEAGDQVGWSGPCYPDQEETSFEAIGQQVELTTVTKLPRRIFTFSLMQIKEAVRQNGVDEIFLNFVNYCSPIDAYAIVQQITEVCKVSYLGYGPGIEDMVETNSSIQPPLDFGVEDRKIIGYDLAKDDHADI
jgi:adenylosuccinate synthase